MKKAEMFEAIFHATAVAFLLVGVYFVLREESAGFLLEVGMLVVAIPLVLTALPLRSTAVLRLPTVAVVTLTTIALAAWQVIFQICRYYIFARLCAKNHTELACTVANGPIATLPVMGIASLAISIGLFSVAGIFRKRSSSG